MIKLVRLDQRHRIIKKEDANGTRLLREMQSKEGNEGRKRSYNEEQKKSNEGQMSYLRYKHVLYHGKIRAR